MCLTIKRVKIMEKNETNHYKNQRYKREKFIKECLGGDGNVIDTFVTDRGHKNGLEVHQLTDNGIIIIYNALSGKLCTKLVARPQQIKRYYELTGRPPPFEYDDILKLAQERQVLGYNNI